MHIGGVRHDLSSVHILFKPNSSPLKSVYALILLALQLISRQCYRIQVHVHQRDYVDLLDST